MQIGLKAYPGTYAWPGLEPQLVEYDTNFYVGPLGALRPLPGTAASVDTTATVIGGTHVSLTGAFTRDRFGVKRRWTWEYPALTANQAKHVEALHRGLVPGPLYLLDPRRPNRLPEQIASGGSVKRSAVGFIPSNTATTYWRRLNHAPADPATLPPAALLRGGIELYRLVRGVAAVELAGGALDGRLDVPVRPGEILSAGFWACGPTGGDVAGAVTVYDVSGAEMVTTPLVTTTLSMAEWRHCSGAFVCPQRAAYARLRLTVGDATPAGSVYVTALQVAPHQQTYIPGLHHYCPDVDLGGGWHLGGGAPQVIPDIGSTGYIGPGLHASALTLLER